VPKARSIRTLYDSRNLNPLKAPAAPRRLVAGQVKLFNAAPCGAARTAKTATPAKWRAPDRHEIRALYDAA
jgi:hypothetical protein